MILESLKNYSAFKFYVEELNQKLIEKGARVSACKVHEPCPDETISEAEARLHLKCPSRTRRLLTEICSGMAWNWTGPKVDESILSPFFSVGQCEWSWEAFCDTGLRDDLTETWGIEDSDYPNEQLWRRSLTLAPIESQYLIIDPEDDWKIKAGGAGLNPREAANVVAKDLPDLLDRWIPIAGAIAMLHHCNWLQAPADDRVDPSQMIRWLQV